MKKLTITLLGFFAISSAFAFSMPENKKSSENLNIVYTSSSSIKLIMMEKEKGNIKLSVVNKETEQLLHKEKLYYDGPTAVPIDLSAQPQGQYEITVQGEDFEYKKDIFISHLDKEDVHASISRIADDKFKVKVLRQDVPVKIVIRDQKGNQVFKRTYTGAQNFEQTFDLGKFSKKSNLIISISGYKSFISKAL